MSDKEIKESIVLEDGIEYGLVDKIIINDIEYVYLTNINDVTDFCIRKTVLEDGEEYLIGLDNDAEFDLAMLHFTKKHHNSNVEN